MVYDFILKDMSNTTKFTRMTIHLLVSKYGDPILFVANTTNGSVRISGAERSFGMKWAAGMFSSDDARSLWDQIIGGGGRVADPSIVATILSLHDEMRHALEDAHKDLKEFQLRLAKVKADVLLCQDRHQRDLERMQEAYNLVANRQVEREIQDLLMGNPSAIAETLRDGLIESSDYGHENTPSPEV